MAAILGCQGLCDQQVGVICRQQNGITGIEGLAGKIHLRDEPVEFSLDFEMNMRRPYPVSACRIGARFYGLEAIPAVMSGEKFRKADKIRVEGRGIGIAGMGIPAQAVGLPDDESRTADSVTIAIENTSFDFDDFALGASIHPIDDGQIARCMRRFDSQKEGP